MENFIVSFVLSQLILVPIAYKWELNLKIVVISGLIIGLLAGSIISIIEVYSYLSLLPKLISCSVLIVLIST
jgi:hypothetical protein